jgi:hypothetical protein
MIRGVGFCSFARTTKWDASWWVHPALTFAQIRDVAAYVTTQLGK